MRQSSLSRRTLKAMALRLAVLITLVTVISYGLMVRSLEEMACGNLSKYVRERGQREEGLFSLASDNHKVLVREFLARYRAAGDAPALRLDRSADGHWRSPKPSKTIGRGHAETGVFLQREAKLTPDLERRLAIGAQLVSELGPAFRPRFQDTYFSYPEGGIAVYWPESPAWVHEIKGDYRIENEEWFRVGIQSASDVHRTRWTGTFLDSVSDSWMASAATPIMQEGRLLAVAHHDLMLDEILSRTIHDRLDGSANYLIHEDGRLIARPRGDSRDLSTELARIRESAASGKIFDTPGWRGDWVSVYQIRGPGWYFVTVYPKALIRLSAMHSAAIVLLLGLISLVLELAVVWWVLSSLVTRPLRQLATATQHIAEGKFSVELKAKGDDELAQFTRSFMRMKRSVEELVEKRTRELEQARARNVQAAKMSALGEMAGGIAHEINNPVAIITAKSAQMREQIDRGMLTFEQIKSGLTRIESTAMRVAQIVRGLRTFSRTGDHDPLSRTRIRAIVEETLSFCREKLRADGVELRMDVDDLEVQCRATQISQVLLNLIVNSQDAIRDLPERWILIQAKVINGSVRISVQDSGGGIAPDVVEKLMTPFFTTKEIGKGTGLGLSISRGIIEDHRGKLYYDDTSRRTRFVFELPT